MKIRSVAFYMALFGFLTGPALAESSLGGDKLYEFHGCINCHGADAKNPVSKMVPNLAGKPAGELFTKSKIVLTGHGATEESEIMHAAFYSPSQCDSPPTDQDLHKITRWISQR